MEQFPDISDEKINLSDVFDVIQNDDSDFVGSSMQEDHQMVERGGSSQLSAYVEIVEQPASKALRFRYECEGRSAGSIPGVNSTPENKTFPTIRVSEHNKNKTSTIFEECPIKNGYLCRRVFFRNDQKLVVGYKGPAMVIVSCVTKDQPYRPHPHNLVGKEGCMQGICRTPISSENMTVTFANLGIQCVKKKDIEEALRIREQNRVDPYRTGFEHKRQPTSIDLNAVRLCFHVFLKGKWDEKFRIPLKPVVSEPIFDKKAMSDLVICKLSHCSASVAGGMEMILLCEKVAKEDINVRFFEKKDGRVFWEAFGDFQPSQVHKQTAIAFRTPKYYTQEIEQPVDVFIQLRRPTDGATSEPVPFQMLPLGSDDPDSLRRKRQKFNNSPINVMKHVQPEAGKNAAMLNQHIHHHLNFIKPEPTDRLTYEGPVASPESFPLYSSGPTFSQPQLNMHTLRMPVSPGRTPSPQECKLYMPPLIQPNLSPHGQLFPDMNQQPTDQLYVPQQFSPMQQNMGGSELQSNNVTMPHEAAGPQVPYNADDLGLDSLPYVEFTSNNPFGIDLAVLGNLSEDLSNGLSISVPMQAQPSESPSLKVYNVEENMIDSLTKLTKATTQLRTLDQIYPSTSNNGN